MCWPCPSPACSSSAASWRTWEGTTPRSGSSVATSTCRGGPTRPAAGSSSSRARRCGLVRWPAPRPVGSRRRGARRVALTRCALWAAPLHRRLDRRQQPDGRAAAAGPSSRVQPGPSSLTSEPCWTPGAASAPAGAREAPGACAAATCRACSCAPRSALRHTADLLHDEVVLDSRPGDRPHAPVETLSALESGPVVRRGPRPACPLDVLGVEGRPQPRRRRGRHRHRRHAVRRQEPPRQACCTVSRPA